MSWLISRAMMEACENSRSLRGQVAEYLAGNCSDGEQSAQLNVMPTQHKFWRNDKTMEFSNLSRFGLTLNLLTESRGEELLTLYLADFPVRTSALPGKEPESQAGEAGFGQRWRGSLAKYDPVSRSLKTAQLSLIEDSIPCSLTLPRWGSMRNGGCYPQPMLVHPTYEKESGFWPTPNCIGYRSDGELRLLSRKARDEKEYLAMSDRACNSKRKRFWPTLTASIGSKCGGRHNGKTDTLASRLAETEGLSTTSTGRVNPTWSEWLMGFPLDWTEIKPWGMDKYRGWLQQHSVSSQKEPAYED